MRAALAAVAERRVWLCDLDGTLVDSGPAHEAAFRDAIAELAPDLLPGFRYERYAGLSTRIVMARLLAAHPHAGGDLAALLARRKQRLYRRYVDEGKVAVLPGARRLLRRLALAGRTAYLVTSGSRGSVERVLVACELGGYFGGVLTADDLTVSKPDPRFYREACELWSVPPSDAVAVEDSPHGVASAVGAGLVTLQVHTARPAPGAVAMPGLDAIASLLDAEPAGG